MGFWINIKGSILLDSYDSNSGILILLSRFVLNDISKDWKSDHCGSIIPVYDKVTEKDSLRMDTKLLKDFKYVKGYLIDLKIESEESLGEFKDRFIEYIDSMGVQGILSSVESILLDVSNTLEGKTVIQYENEEVIEYRNGISCMKIGDW